MKSFGKWVDKMTLIYICHRVNSGYFKEELQEAHFVTFLLIEIIISQVRHGHDGCKNFGNINETAPFSDYLMLSLAYQLNIY